MRTKHIILLEYANSHRDGFTAIYDPKKQKLIKATRRNSNRYAVAFKTVIELYEHYTVIHEALLNVRNTTTVGGYYNDIRHCYQIELVKTFDDIDIAIRMAKAYKQYSIYDLWNKHEIVVDVCSWHNEGMKMNNKTKQTYEAVDYWLSQKRKNKLAWFKDHPTLKE